LDSAEIAAHPSRLAGENHAFRQPPNEALALDSAEIAAREFQPIKQ
jgi:hypothetical protein